MPLADRLHASSTVAKGIKPQMVHVDLASPDSRKSGQRENVGGTDLAGWPVPRLYTKRTGHAIVLAIKILSQIESRQIRRRTLAQEVLVGIESNGSKLKDRRNEAAPLTESIQDMLAGHANKPVLKQDEASRTVGQRCAVCVVRRFPEKDRLS